MDNKRIRVLIVDDSAFARKVIREVLSGDTDIEVLGIARDGLDAIEKIAQLKPDVITLDLVMPDLDGLGVLKMLSNLEDPPKVIIVSASGSDAELTIEALQNGAFDLVTKPTALPTDRLYELSSELVEKVKAAAVAKAERKVTTGFKRDVKALPLEIKKENIQARLIVIGTSTGGPQALTQFFKMLPAEFPIPIAVALHIPAGYTAQLALRITQNSAVSLIEAYTGLELKAGQAVIAPGGKHLKIIARENSFFAHVSVEPSETLYHPSVDLLFESAATAAGNTALGILLTGMGSDGTQGAKLIKNAGGIVLAESESSCVVYGMPRSAIEAHVTDAQAPLEKMVGLLLEQMRKRNKLEVER